MRRRVHRAIVPFLALGLSIPAIAACGGDDSASPDAPPTTATDGEPDATAPTQTEVAAGCTTEDTGPLEVVLVNDDGVTNPAIDVLIDRLSEVEDLEVDVTVVAPVDERSGTSDTTTPGEVTYTEATTPGGSVAYAVDGYPADAVLVALEELGLEPHLVLSGINPGQNFGPFAPLSGTVGAARTAIRNGVPALAVSAGIEFDEEQFDVGADLALDWIAEHCEALIAGEQPTDTLASINVPGCPPDEMGPLLEVPRALEFPDLPEATSLFESTCDLADPDPADDVTAVRSGYPAITQVEADFPAG